MPLLRLSNIKRSALRAQPKWLWVFGDNFTRQGMGGQAAEMRGEPNAVGLVTKRTPGWMDFDFLTDWDLFTVQEISKPDIAKLQDCLRTNGTVVWPRADIGTGRAQLARRAPRVRKFWDEILVELQELGKSF